MYSVEYNKSLVERFPFLIPTNRWTGEVVKDYDYTWTELDGMPDGWRKAFGEEMCQEVMDVLTKEDWLDTFRILDIKEKYATLRFYPNYTSDALNAVISKYEEKSQYTCIRCGAPATHISLGWYSPFCENCLSPSVNYIPINEYWNELNSDKEDEDDEESENEEQ